jgi:hypothetical protein
MAHELKADIQRELKDDMRGITSCWQNLGYHVYMAGPCFDTREQARVYRDGLDRDGIRWRPQT